MNKLHIIISLLIGIVVGVVLCTRMLQCDPVSSTKEPHCNIPEKLPQWNELVLRLWGNNVISTDTFKKNFPIVGEKGSKVLKAQGHKDLEQLTDCLVENFKIEE